MKFNWTVIGLFILSACSAQNFFQYYNHANEAEYQINLGNFRGCRKILTAVESDYGKLRPKEYFYLGLAGYYESDTVSGLKNIEKSIQGFLFNSAKLEKLSGKFGGPLVSEFTIKNLVNLETKYRRIKDSVLSSNFIGDSMQYFVDIDQANHSSSKKGSLYDYQHQVAYLGFLQRYGLQDALLYGEMQYLVFSHIIDGQLFKKYHDFVFTELKAGKVCPLFYARLVDAWLYRKSPGSNTRYGTYLFVSKKIKQSVIDKHRKQIGLSVYCERCSCNQTVFTKLAVKQ